MSIIDTINKRHSYRGKYKSRSCVLTMLVTFSRPWHKSVLTDDDKDEDLKEN